VREREQPALIHPDAVPAVKHAVQQVPGRRRGVEADFFIVRLFPCGDGDGLSCFGVQPVWTGKPRENVDEILSFGRQKDLSIEKQLISVFFQLRKWESGFTPLPVRNQNRFGIRLHVRIVQHVDCVPWADRQLIMCGAVVGRAITHLATNTPGRINLVIALAGNMAGNFKNAVHRTDCGTGLATGAGVLIDDVDIADFLFAVVHAGAKIFINGNGHRRSPGPADLDERHLFTNHNVGTYL